MVNCPGCGAANQEDSLNCVACNRLLKIICPACGSKNAVLATTCMECGKKLEGHKNSKANASTVGDPVAEMFAPVRNITPEKPPKKAVVMLLVGVFVFSILYLSKACDGHPFLLLICGLISGIVALKGLIELTFWFIDDRNLADSSFSENPVHNEEQENNLSESSFPESSNTEVSENFTPLADTDKDIEISAKASGHFENFELGTPLEATPESEEKSPSADKHYDSLAEFLEDGITNEISDIKDKLEKSPENYALMLRLAQLYEERGEIDNAVTYLDGCVKRDPESAEVYLYYGTLLRQKGRLDDAQMAFEKALKINRFMSKAYYQLGLLEKARGNFEQTRDFLQKSIQLSPDDPYAHYQLGMTYKELGNTELAVMEVKRATVLHPTDSYGHSRLGQFYQQLKKWDLAIASYSKAISLKPKDDFVLERMAEVLACKGNHERAIEIYQDILANQFHQKPDTMLALAKSFKAIGKWIDLQEATTEILRLEPENYDAAYLLAYSVMKQDRIDEAIHMFEGLVAHAKDCYEGWFELGRLYQMVGHNELAISAFTKAAAGASDQAGIWNTIGILLSNEKLYIEALRAFQKAVSFDYTDASIAENLKAVQHKVELDAGRIIETRREKVEQVPDDIDAYLEMGKAYEIIDMTNEALQCYQRVLAIDPKYIPGLMAYAEMLRKMGKLKMAMRCYREIIKLEPKNLDAHLFMINSNLSLGFINEAHKYATTAEKLAGEDMRVHFLLGKIYFAKGLAPRALKEFTAVTDTPGDPDLISWAELMRKRLLRTNKQ